MNIEQSQREFMQAVDRAVRAASGSDQRAHKCKGMNCHRDAACPDKLCPGHPHASTDSDLVAIEANETAFERRVTWAACAVIVGLSAYAFFL